MADTFSVPFPTPFPTGFDGVEALEDYMTTPDEALIADLASLDGDIIVLGIGGKMGPTLARMAKCAAPDKNATSSKASGRAEVTHVGIRGRVSVSMECSGRANVMTEA